MTLPLSQVPNEEHREILKRLYELNQQFYGLCFIADVGSRAHSFIEFNGLINKYIDLLVLFAEQGIDPHTANDHNDVDLSIDDHHMRYLGDKLKCIFGPLIRNDPRARAILAKSLGL